MKRNKKNAGAASHPKNDEAELFPTVVANITNKQIFILFKGKQIPCMIPGALASQRNSLAVGDKVQVSHVGNDQFKLIQILPRETALYRGNRRLPGEEILVAANIQFLLAVVPAEDLIHQTGYPEAALIAARRTGVDAGLFISKWDRIGDRAQALVREKSALYSGFTGPVSMGSAQEAGEELIQAVKGKTTVVTGDRGCGKTSLIHSILAGLGADHADGVNPASTHSVTLHVGPGETFLIDVPGFRDFSLNRITEEERGSVFPEIARLAEKCYFSSCTHTHEEGCQVIEALRSGDIKKERYHAYQGMAGSNPEPKTRKSEASGIDYRHAPCTESFVCKVCGTLVIPEGAGSRHRNHCPKCLSSIHVDEEPGDRASLCHGIMDPVSVWVRKNGEWAIIHRCRLCGAFSSNRIAADDNPMLLMSIAVRPLSAPPFPLNDLTSFHS